MINLPETLVEMYPFCKSLNLLDNPFNSIDQVVSVLRQLNSLESLQIMIKNESEAETIIRDIVTLRFLNGHEVNREALYDSQ